MKLARSKVGRGRFRDGSATMRSANVAPGIRAVIQGPPDERDAERLASAADPGQLWTSTPDVLGG